MGSFLQEVCWDFDRIGLSDQIVNNEQWFNDFLTSGSLSDADIEICHMSDEDFFVLDKIVNQWFDGWDQKCCTAFHNEILRRSR